MSEQHDVESNVDSQDGINDALAATAVIVLVVAIVVFWLSGMPA